MTRKDYIAIAQALLDNRPLEGERAAYRVWEAIVCSLADNVLARDNPRFDRVRFLKASGVYGEVAS